MIFMIYGCGTPLRIESYHPEVAEARAVERYGYRIEKLSTVRFEDDMLSGGSTAGSIEGFGGNSDS